MTDSTDDVDWWYPIGEDDDPTETDMDQLNYETYEELLSDAEGQAETDWEVKFVNDMRERFDKYGPDAYVSDRQRERLEKIAYGE